MQKISGGKRVDIGPMSIREPISISVYRFFPVLQPQFGVNIINVRFNGTYFNKIRGGYFLIAFAFNYLL